MATGLLERITKVRRTKVEPKAELLICPDCGIDLPTTWHWDGCSRDPRQAAR